MDNHQLWHLLHALDDPDHLEFPADYHHRRARDRFEQLARRLDADFGCRCDVDRHVQDASLHPGVWSDAEAASMLHPDDARRVHTGLADLGFTLVPEEPLWQPYDGVCDPAVLAPSSATWWIRYFDYL